MSVKKGRKGDRYSAVLWEVAGQLGHHLLNNCLEGIGKQVQRAFQLKIERETPHLTYQTSPRRVSYLVYNQ